VTQGKDQIKAMQGTKQAQNTKPEQMQHTHTHISVRGQNVFGFYTFVVSLGGVAALNPKPNMFSFFAPIPS
jgi:hypothetical protein